MSGMTRGIVGRVPRSGWRAKVALALGLGAGLGAAGLGIAAAGGPACDPASIRERVAALEAKYDAMPELTDPEAVYQRSQRFEEEWKALGALCSRPNGTEPEPPLGPKDDWVYVDRIGIHPSGETWVRGYDVVNGWTQVVDVDGAPFVVHVAAVFSSEDPARVGVIVYRYGPAPVVVLTDEWGSTQGTIVDPVVGSPGPA